jgi:predicted acyltransferase
LFCVGIAIPFSVASFRRKNQSIWKYDLRVFRRVLILLALGAILDSVGDHRLIFFSIGILQTIAIAYAISALLYDLPIYRRLIFAAAGLICYWAAIKYLPIPGAATGAFSENQNFIIHLNRTYLGQVGLWGLPRIIPTTALTLIGTAIGDLIRDPVLSGHSKTKWLLISGSSLVIAGSLWALSVPFNKPIWTPSYILFSAGTGTLVLGFFYEILDLRGWCAWAFPLIVFGSNAILAYVLPILVKGLILIPLHLSINGWFRVGLFILFWWVVFWILYRKKFFLRV